ncbi:MAG: DUF2310 family Zn-ribbon-containing protein [Candidatus Nealsonbacteria bacterium]|nr:DUF2310 family Zn-ribbon-containing protein [Candidatus Nealsonbacteria bacterium]
MTNNDPYWKLKPPSPTPDDELCSCLGDPAVVLQPHLSCNPISCADCNLEVPPERLGFSEQLADELASWRTFHDCFFHLWLDSAEFEAWAKSQLFDPQSPVNTRGLALRQSLAECRPCYYWWFLDTDAEDFQQVSMCPRCKRNLSSRGSRSVCEDCWIIVAN